MKSLPCLLALLLGAGDFPARRETFEILETLAVGEFSVDLCRREDGAFGLGEIRHGKEPLRRADFLITWQVGGRFPVFARREGMSVALRDPPATLSFHPEARTCAGTELVGLRLHFAAEGKAGPLVETASWELGGSTKGLSYFDGYRGWHAPPGWLPAAAVPETNPKLAPTLLHGTGFQFEHGAQGALLIFHTTPGDRLRNASRGEALEFVTTFDGPPAAVDRHVFKLSGQSRIDLWSRALEVTQAELRRALGLPEPVREVVCVWPPFGRHGFRATAEACAAKTAEEGFTAVLIDVIWDNLEFHGGKKNMNVWDYSVCEGYGGEEGLQALVRECRKHGLRVIAWAPVGHLNAEAPVWKEHPDWVLKNPRGENALNPSGLVQGDLNTGFAEYFRGRFVEVIRKFDLAGLWLDSHLAYAQQQSPSHGARLAAIYRDFMQAGARHLIAEGDASVLGAYGVAIGEDWKVEWGKIPDPDLYYGATLMSGFLDGRLHREHFRRYVAAGAAWAVRREFLDSPKLEGEEIAAARRDALDTIRDYRRVKDRMVHRFVHEDGSGTTWTNDRDGAKVVWLFADARLPDGRQGRAGSVHVIEP